MLTAPDIADYTLDLPASVLPSGPDDEPVLELDCLDDTRLTGWLTRHRTVTELSDDTPGPARPIRYAEPCTIALHHPGHPTMTLLAKSWPVDWCFDDDRGDELNWMIRPCAAQPYPEYTLIEFDV